MTLAGKIERLDHLSTAELAAEYETITGRRPRYRSLPWLRKRIALEIQTRLYGGLPSRARAELADGQESGPLEVVTFTGSASGSAAGDVGREG